MNRFVKICHDMDNLSKYKFWVEIEYNENGYCEAHFKAHDIDFLIDSRTMEVRKDVREIEIVGYGETTELAMTDAYLKYTKELNV